MWRGEERSFNWQLSSTSWTQVPNNTQIAIVELNWSDSKDSVEVDLLVEVPSSEEPTTKSSTIYFESSLAE